MSNSSILYESLCEVSPALSRERQVNRMKLFDDYRSELSTAYRSKLIDNKSDPKTDYQQRTYHQQILLKSKEYFPNVCPKREI